MKFVSFLLILGALASSIMVNRATAAPALEGTECRLDRGRSTNTVKAECIEFTVAENPAEVDGAEIRLRVARIRALNVQPLPDPLVILAGGPGQSAIDLYLAYRGAFERVRRERDILLVDQRGTGESNPLSCDSTDVLGLSEPNAEQIAELTRLCLEDIEGDPRYYTTSVAVRDLEALRQALDLPTLNLYGVSYGTRVAQHYLRRYPQTTRRVILDGVVYPELILGPAIALDAQKSLDAIFARCNADAACQQHFPDLPRAFAEIYQRLSEQEQTVRLRDPGSGQFVDQRFSELELASVVRLLSYSPSTVALLPLMIYRAWEDDDYQPLAARARAIESQFAEALSVGMHNSVVCSEDAPFYSEPPDAELAATYIGSYLLETLVAVCGEWPQGLVDEDFKDPLQSDVPVLLLSGENDPVTPPAYAEIALKGLSQHQHIVGPGQGHGLIAQGCVPNLVAKFLSDEVPIPVDAACAERLVPMPFFVDFQGPLQ